MTSNTQNHISSLQLASPQIVGPIIALHHRPLSPKMTTRAQHGIIKFYKLFILHTLSPNSISPLPTNHIHVLHDHNWKIAMKDEYDYIIENTTYELVSYHPNASII